MFFDRSVQSWSLISAVPGQMTIPALKWDPALSRDGAVLHRTRSLPLIASDINHIKLGSGTKGYRTTAGPSLLYKFL